MKLMPCNILKLCLNFRILSLGILIDYIPIAMVCIDKVQQLPNCMAKIVTIKRLVWKTVNYQSLTETENGVRMQY